MITETMTKLDIHSLQNNLKTLKKNSRKAARAAMKQLLSKTVREGIHILWMINRPITLMNQWVIKKKAEISHSHKNHRQEKHDLHLQMERMDGEGPTNNTKLYSIGG